MEGDEHMQLSMPEKETSRLYLRGMEEADACDIYDYYRQACVTQFLTFPPHPDVEHTLHILKAVSYTHLDVYKRQQRSFPWKTLI